MQPEKAIHRLECHIVQQTQDIKKLQQKYSTSQAELACTGNELENLRSRINTQANNSEVHSSNQSIQLIESTISSMTWQILQLQQINLTYENTIKDQQKQLMINQHRITIDSQRIRQLETENQQIKTDAEFYEVLKKWRQSLKEKERINLQNEQLKQQLARLQNHTLQEINKYVNVVERLNKQLNQLQDNEKKRVIEFEERVSEIKAENERLQQSILQKNDTIKNLLQKIHNKNCLMTNTDLNYLHTIKNLRTQIRKRNKQFSDILQRLRKAEQCQAKYEQFNLEFQNSFAELETLSSTCKSLKQENAKLVFSLEEEKSKNIRFEESWHDDSEKFLELLKENQACHQLLYEMRGSNIYKRDISEKIELIMKKLHMRREHEQQWLDITELINVNKRLRMHRCVQC